MNEITIKVFEKVGSGAAVSSEIGRSIYSIIEGALEQGHIAVLDFENINIITSAFLNSSIGRLYHRYSSEELQSYVKLLNMSDDDRILLKKVTDRAKEYFLNKEKLDNIIDNSLNDGQT